MLHKRLVSALTKVGAVVTEHGCCSFSATKADGSTVVWRLNSGGRCQAGDSVDQYVSHVTKKHPDTDAMFDNFMDDYLSTIKGAVQAISEPPYKSYKNVK